MDFTERLQAWGAAHALARRAELAARDRGQANCRELQREAQSLRERADRMHREIYRSLEPGSGGAKR